MDPWLTLAGILGIGLVLGWLAEGRLGGAGPKRPRYTLVTVLLLLVALAGLNTGWPSAFVAACALLAGGVVHRVWLGSIADHSIQGESP